MYHSKFYDTISDKICYTYNTPWHII